MAEETKAIPAMIAVAHLTPVKLTVLPLEMAASTQAILSPVLVRLIRTLTLASRSGTE